VRKELEPLEQAHWDQNEHGAPSPRPIFDVHPVVKTALGEFMFANLTPTLAWCRAKSRVKATRF